MRPTLPPHFSVCAQKRSTVEPAGSPLIGPSFQDREALDKCSNPVRALRTEREPISMSEHGRSGRSREMHRSTRSLDVLVVPKAQLINRMIVCCGTLHCYTIADFSQALGLYRSLRCPVLTGSPARADCTQRLVRQCGARSVSLQIRVPTVQPHLSVSTQKRSHRCLFSSCSVAPWRYKAPP